MTYWVNGFTGTVEECQRRSETDVSGDISGGGGSIDPETGGTIGGVVGYINTSVSRTLEIYVKNAEKERHFDLGSLNFPVRKGHVVTVIWAARDGEKSGRYVAVHNHTLQRTSERFGVFCSLTQSGVMIRKNPPAYTEADAQSVTRVWNYLVVAAVLFGWIPGILIAFGIASQHPYTGLGHIMAGAVPVAWVFAFLLIVTGRVVADANADERVKAAKEEVERRYQEAKQKSRAESDRLQGELNQLIRAYIEKVGTT